ncbi:MAG: M23 family metallopeptidase [Rhodospirillales bacterium]|nr:M23 family metallopeptidase [Rhodospirillales bacterium]
MSLEGDLRQGGLVIGMVEPGVLVDLEGKPVRVSKDGLFVLGFGRNAKQEWELVTTTPNGISESKFLEVKPRRFNIQRINGLPNRKVTPNPVDVARIKDDNKGIGQVRRLDTDNPLFISGFQWPLKGRISGVFGSQRILNGKARNPHNGVDIAAPEGTNIVAPADGIIALVHQDMFYTGKTMMIDHGHGLSTVYAHMSEINVTEGQEIKKGQIIGKVGQTGRATGPHLHWGMSLFSTHLDPALAAGEMGK